jgi:hypothetical protein
MLIRKALFAVLFGAAISLVPSIAFSQSEVNQKPASDSQQKIKIFRTKNLDPGEAWNVLSNLFPNQNPLKNGLTLAVEPRMKALIAKGDDEQLKQVEALLLNLDENAQADKSRSEFATIRLKNMPVGQFMAQFSHQFGAVVGQADERTNSLILEGPEPEVAKIEKLISTLDTPGTWKDSADTNDVSIRMVWLVGKAIATEKSPPVPIDLAPAIDALQKKTGIDDLRMAAQILVHKSPNESADFNASGTAVFSTVYRITFSGSVKRNTSNKYSMKIHAKASSLHDDTPICEIDTQCRTLVPGRPVILGTSTVSSQPSVFVIQILENTEK